MPSVTEHLWSLGLAVFLSAPPISTSPNLPVLNAASERLPSLPALDLGQVLSSQWLQSSGITILVLENWESTVQSYK